jgi:hypothetical protein
MPTYNITVGVLRDYWGDGQFRSPDVPLVGGTVTLSGAGSGTFTQGPTDNGLFSVTIPDDPATFTLTAAPPALNPGDPPWMLTTPPDPLTFSLGTAAGTFVTEVFFGYAATECFRRGSSWVDRVCWVPWLGVRVQFKDRRGTPYFCCYYPGTTYQDYLSFRVAPSLGRHVRLWYYYRPYVPVPVGS